MFDTGVGFSSSGGAFAKQLIALYTTSLGNAYWVIGIAAFTTMFSTTLTTLDASPRAMAKTAQILQLPIVLSLFVLDFDFGNWDMRSILFCFPTWEHLFKWQPFLFLPPHFMG